MRFLVLIAYDESTWAAADAGLREEFFDAHHAFEQAVYARGSLVGGGALAATNRGFTLRHGGDGWQRTDGPFAETTEQIGGFYVVDVPDERAAQEAAQCLPRQYTLEIRPEVDIDGYERSEDLRGVT